MLKISNFEVVGWQHAVRGMRNPKNSHHLSDSSFKEIAEVDVLWDQEAGEVDKQQVYFDALNIGPNDHKLMMQLRNAGTDHRKFLRMIAVYMDITAPLYWWKEFDTYKVGTVANSCSTMHKIAAKEFTLDDFSYEHLDDDNMATDVNGGDHFYPLTSLDILKITIEGLNYWRNRYNSTKDKEDWWQMIQLLPTSYNQKRTVMLNYEVLANIYKSRRHHKLDEWHTLCDWVEELPYSELITGKVHEVVE